MEAAFDLPVFLNHGIDDVHSEIIGPPGIPIRPGNFFIEWSIGALMCTESCRESTIWLLSNDCAKSHRLVPCSVPEPEDVSVNEWIHYNEAGQLARSIQSEL